MKLVPLTILLSFTIMVGSSFAQEAPLEIYILGPSGGTGGVGFTDEIKDRISVKEVNIWTGSVVNGINIVHSDSSGGYYATHRYGSSEGTKHTFTLQADEYITGISGRYGTFVDSIIIHTNNRMSRSYGGTGGSAEYIYEAPSGYEVAGFCGREGKGEGDVIDAIGVVLRPAPIILY
jgi:hypothetical protein